jgi:hypothetical protein
MVHLVYRDQIVSRMIVSLSLEVLFSESLVESGYIGSFCDCAGRSSRAPVRTRSADGRYFESV